MFKALGGIIDRVFVVAGAVCFAQTPHFFQAYTQRLGGHVAELKIQSAYLHVSAQKTGKTVAEYVHKFLTHLDPDIALQGEFMQTMQERFVTISSAYHAMVDSTVLTRPFQFLRHVQWDVAQMTLKDFQFGLSLTLEAGLYALVGMGVGYLLFCLLRAIAAFPISGKKKMSV